MRYLVLLLSLIMLLPGFSTAQVRINEVLYNPTTGSDQIELKNFGSSAVDVSSWWFCARFIYNQISSLTVESGSLNIPPGGFLVLSGKALNDTGSDLALYITNVFSDENNMRDFVEWGSASNGRETEAVRKGIWSAGEFVTGVAQGHSIEYDGMGSGAGAWNDASTPTLGAENSNVTSVEDGPDGIPTGFTLQQNFPNPFNPSTIIRYTIPQTVTVAETRLEIFNVLGQKVRTLVNTRQSAGTYTLQWDGTDDSGTRLATGLYGIAHVYQLRAGEFVEMKKMLFLK
ncbi:MAG: FlgD immunoglobulin-like domain containing protein [bacterium]